MREILGKFWFVAGLCSERPQIPVAGGVVSPRRFLGTISMDEATHTGPQPPNCVSEQMISGVMSQEVREDEHQQHNQHQHHDNEDCAAGHRGRH
jgi:hypothetical protein